MNLGDQPKAPQRREQSLRRIIEHISSELDLRRLLTQIVQSACELLGTDSGSIGLLDPDLNVFRIEAVHRMPEGELGSEWGEGEGLTGQVLQAKMPIVLNRYRETIPDSDLTAAFGVPIFWRGTLTGFLGLGSAGDRKFGADDVIHLEHFARHAAIAIENARLYEENQRAMAQASMLLRTTERIGNAMSVDQVIEAYLDQVAGSERYYCTVVLYDFDDDGVKIGNTVRGQWSPGGEVVLMSHPVPTKQDFLDPILSSGKTVRIANALTESRIPKSLKEEQIRDNRPAIALIPLMADARQIGLVVLSDPKPHEWTDEELFPFQTTANQLAAAITSRRDHDARIDSNRKVAVLEERRKIARDLHDSVTQVLFSLNLLAQTLEPGQVPPTEIVERLNSLSRRGLQEMRHLLEELRPVQPEVKPPGLAQRISSYVSTLVDFPEFELNDTGYQALPEVIEIQVFRVAQEALNNVAKHAQARQAKVTLQTSGNSVKLRVEDDGVGLKRENMKNSRSGFGLDGMHERAQEIGADLCVESNPGKGTCIELVYPAEGR